MNGKKAYVSPQVIRVKLEPSQAVLSQCFTGVTATRNNNLSGDCISGTHPCKRNSQPGNQAANS